jgi:hypothetical protein
MYNSYVSIKKVEGFGGRHTRKTPCEDEARGLAERLKVVREALSSNPSAAKKYDEARKWVMLVQVRQR